MSTTPASPVTTSRHRWKFYRIGGFDQVHLTSGADLLALDQLDQKLWFALACPTRGIEFDAHTLDLIDSDHDGRACISVPFGKALTQIAHLPTGAERNLSDPYAEPKSGRNGIILQSNK